MSNKLSNKKAIRTRLHARIRNKVEGVGSRPRLSVNFTGQHIYAQIIDDEVGKTLVSVMTTEKELEGSKLRPNVKSAEQVGKLIAERAQTKNIKQVVFDRGGYLYHGRIKALADAAREAGLEF